MTTDVTDRIGPRVRTLREERGLSLRDLAGRSGVSAPMLSQVERGETSPTLTVAARIAAGLDLTLSRLLRLEEGDHVRIVRAGDPQTNRRGAHAWRDLTTPLDRVSVSTHTLRSGGRTGGAGDPPIHSPGSRETIVVQTGRLALVLDDARYELDEGDAVTFDADLPHHLETMGRASATFLAVVTRGLREA
jgi:XRE family transcriptional regulator, regulator of sulfur utilization